MELAIKSKLLLIADKRCMNVLLSILYRKSIELTIKATLLLIAYKNNSRRKSHLLVLLVVKLLPTMRFTKLMLQNGTLLMVGECMKNVSAR